MAPAHKDDPLAEEDEKISEKETPEHRRARLWLGYSADNLRNSENLANGRSRSQMNLSNEKQRPSPPVQKGSARNDRDGRSRGDYTLPKDYENLDEVTAPSPIESPQKERKQGYLEDRNIKSSSNDNLNEIAAPSPVENAQNGRKEGYLEDRGSDSPSTDEKEDKNGTPPRRQRASKLATEIYTISYLIFFSIMGTLARLGLQALTFYPGAPVQTSLLWANVGGSLIMGFLSEDRKLFREEWGTPSSPEKSNGDDEEKGKTLQRSPSAGQRHAAVKKTLPLYIGLATGFCGSFTSFSSFMRDCYFALSNALQVPVQHPSTAPISTTLNVHRNPGYSFMAVLAVLIITVGLCLGALQLGAHLALGLEPFTPSIPFLFARKIVDRSVVLLALGCWLAAIFMAIWPPDRPDGPVGDVSWAQETWRSQALFALIFAPLGCLLRFYASLHLNGKIKSFPLGTFAVNIFGTMMEAIFLDLQRVPVGGMVGCQVLQGMSDGFCGCLTTVSTWVAELTGLRLKHAYFYGLMSVGVALGLMVIIVGSLQWTNGFKSVMCTT
ncbi:hypothetical protein IMSHALPRED_002170 [Imshaugia aleurites]|uniref:Chromosome condensation protein n=1 Tax=Imshaugia aleurites TaxID=172621 RepID=A0A8H3PGH7_9LECA|nr:hypothetical protein IMSHALPRED_002170 [Imshaugia aleurites]